MNRLASVLALVVAACQPGGPGTDVVDDVDTSEPSDALTDLSAPATATVEAQIPASGGVVGNAGVRLHLPPGAAPAGTTIRIVADGEPPADYADVATPLYRFEPDGLTFDGAVEIRFPLATPADDLVVHWSTPVGGWNRRVDTRVDGDAVVATVEHFSTGFVSGPGPQTEVFTKPAEAVVDVLTVVDNSCSMIEEQATLVTAMPALADLLVGTDLDWHLGVVSTDMELPDHKGKLQVSGGYRYVDETTVDPLAVFGQMAQMGTGGSTEEKPLAASWTAILQPTRAVQGANQGFFRPDGQLLVVFVSDEDDQSSPTVSRFQWLGEMKAALSDPDDLHAVAIVGPSPSGCSGDDGDADPGSTINAVSNAVDGTFQSICDADWTPAFETAAAKLRATECQPLTDVPDPATIEVFLHPSGDVLSADDWGYVEDDNCVFLSIAGNAVVGTSDVGVTYEPLVP